MTRDDLKKLLLSYTDMKKEQAQLLETLDRVEATMTAPPSPNMDGMPRGGSGPGDPTGDLATQHLALMGKYRAQLRYLARAQAAIEDLIEPLDSRARTLMRYRYIDGLTWEGVCVAIGYSWRQTHNIHSQALDRLLELQNVAK